jgi:hypothetical protein
MPIAQSRKVAKENRANFARAERRKEPGMGSMWLVNGRKSSFGGGISKSAVFPRRVKCHIGMGGGTLWRFVEVGTWEREVLVRIMK